MNQSATERYDYIFTHNAKVMVKAAQTMTVNVTIVDDDVEEESEEQFMVEMKGAAVGKDFKSVNVTIKDDDRKLQRVVSSFCLLDN